MDREQAANKFEQHCIIELFGHNKIAGFVTEETIGGCAFLRVDVPTVDGGGVQFTKYFGNGAIYAMNVTTKEEVLKVVGWMFPKPPVPRAASQLTAGDNDDDQDDDDDDDLERPF